MRWRDERSSRHVRRFGLAEPAFDTAVNQGIDERQEFEMGGVTAGGGIVEDHPGIQQSRRVGQLLDGPYYGQGVVALLAAEEGRHVAPRAMLGFERAVVPAGTRFRETSFISAS